MQETMNVQSLARYSLQKLPPRCPIKIILKSPESTQMGYCWSHLDSYSIDLTKYQILNITHRTSHITNVFLSLKNIMDKNSGGLQQFIRTEPQ